MSDLERIIDDALEDCVEDRLRENRDISAIDHMELVLMRGLSKNRFDNEDFYKVSDVIRGHIEPIEDILRHLGRGLHEKIHVVLDVLVGDQVRKNGDLDKLSDEDYYWVEDQLNSEIHELLYGRQRGARRGRGGHRDDRDYDRGRGRGGYRDTRRGDMYADRSDPRGDPRDRYDVSGGRSRPAPRDGGYDFRGRGRAQPQDTRRSVRSNDGFSQIARMQQQHDEVARSDRTRDDRHEYDDRYEDHGEDVSYEPVDRNERGRGHSAVVDTEQEELNQVRNSFRQAANGETPTVARGGRGQVLTPPPPEQQGIDHTTDYPYEVFWEDDRLWQASVKSDMKLTGVGIDAMPQLYNIYKYVSYHVMDQYGNVTQEFKDVTDDNRYINQTLVKDPDNFNRAFARKIPKIDTMVNKGEDSEARVAHETSTTSEGMELGDIIDLNQNDLANVNTIVGSDNLSTSAIEARTRLSEIAGKKSSLSMFILMDPIEATNISEANLVRELYSQSTLMALSKSLLDLEGKISKYTFDKINKRLGESVIDEMVNAFGIDITSMNFAKHWPTVMKTLSGESKRYPAEWLDNFSRTMNRMIPTFLGVVDVVESNGEISPFFEHIVTQENKDRVIPLVDFCAIISLDCTLDELSIGRQLELSSPITIRAGDDLYSCNTIHAVMNELRDFNDQTRPKLILSTRCGAMVEVRQHELQSSNLVLSLFKA